MFSVKQAPDSLLGGVGGEEAKQLEKCINSCRTQRNGMVSRILTAHDPSDNPVLESFLVFSLTVSLMVTSYAQGFLIINDHKTCLIRVTVLSI